MAATRPSNCHLCGQRLIGTFFTYENGLVVCSHCNATVAHCDLCGIPSRQLILVRGEHVCPACYQKLPVCACCGIPILKERFTIGDSPLPYCQTCMTDRPHCGVCRAPLNDQGKTIREHDGNSIHRCASCYRSAVAGAEEAQRLYQETRSLLKRELKLDIPMLPELHIVERAKLMALHRQNSTSGTAETSLEEPQHLLGFFRRVGEKLDIYIEQVLPRTLFQAVAAHELAHAWQALNAPSKQPLRIVEGFAEWVAFRILLALGQQAEAARLTRRNDLYGEGLQYFIHLEQERGRNGVLQRAVR